MRDLSSTQAQKLLQLTWRDLKIKKQDFIRMNRCVSDSQWLITFLRGCKFSLERTKSKIEMFYTLRTALPEFYANRDPMLPEIQYILKLG